MRNDNLPMTPPGSHDQLPVRRDAAPDHRLSALNSAQLLMPSAENQAGQNEIDLLAYWQLLVKRRWLIFGIVSAALALALIQTLLTTPTYRATAIIQIEKESIQVMDVRGVTQTEAEYDPSYNQTQFGLLKSRPLAERVAEDLHLVGSDIGQRLAAPTWWQRLRRLLGFGGQTPVKPATATAAASAASGKADQLRAAAGIVQGGLSVEPVRNSHLVKINFESVIPAFSAQVANAVADGFIASTMDRQFGASSYAKKYLEEQLEQLKSRLEESERVLVEFAQKESIVPTKDGTSLAAENLSSMNAALARAQDQRIRAEARWNAAKTNSRVLPADMSSGTALPLLHSLEQQLATLQAQYQNNLQTFKPDYPTMQALKAQIDGVQKQIDTEYGNVRASIKAEYDASLAQEKMLEAQLDKLRVASLDVDNRSIQYNILKRDADTNRQLYNALLQRYKEVGIAGGAKSSNISIIDRAEIPTSHYEPVMSRNLGVGLLVGAMFGILFALLLEYLDDTLRTPLDIEKHLHLPVLGIIPKLNKEVPEDAQKDPRSPFSESYRSVRTALQFSTDRGTPKVLLITSPAAGEGKSTASLTLARGLSQLGKRVLLIEGDMRRPSLSKTLHITGDFGLSNLLAGGSTLAQTVVKTDNPRLDVIFSGPIPPNPTELLAGPKMVSLLIASGEKYDQVIIDGPPVLGIADAPVLANIASGTLLVTKSSTTRISSAKSSIKRLWTAHARLIGAMINQHAYKTVAYGYNYYGYSYGDRLKLTKK